MEQWMPDHLLSRLKRIPRPHWYAFAGAWLAGLFAHGYMFANKLPNHDDVQSFLTKGVEINLGRWGLGVVGKLDGSYSAPWMLGLFSLFLLAVTAMLLVEILRVQRPLFAALTGAVLVVFPTVTSMFAYMFTSDAYAVSILLAVLAAFLARRGRWWLLAAAACVTASLSIYQAFLGWTAALLVYGLYAESIRQQANAKKIFLSGVWQALALGLGVAAYLGLTKLFLALSDSKLDGYMYMDQMGEFHPEWLPNQLREAYGNFFGVWKPGGGRGLSTTNSIRLLLAGCLVLLCVLAAGGILRQLMRRKYLEAALAALLAALFPVGVNVIWLMHTSSVHTLMSYPMCMLPIALLALCDGWNALRFPKGAAGLLRVAGSWLVAGCVGLLILRYGMLANEAYLEMQINHTRRLSYWSGIVTQIRSLPEYDPALPVALVGDTSEDPNLPIWWHNHNLDHLCGTDLAIRQVSDQRFLSLYLAYEPSYADSITMGRKPEVQAMPSYPARGSVDIVDGVIVVKICDI